MHNFNILHNGHLLNAWTNQPTFSRHSMTGMTIPIVQTMKSKLKEFVICPWLAVTDPIASERMAEQEFKLFLHLQQLPLSNHSHHYSNKLMVNRKNKTSLLCIFPILNHIPVTLALYPFLKGVKHFSCLRVFAHTVPEGTSPIFPPG